MTEHQAPAERLSDEKLREILAGCEGVTPGPWGSDAFENDAFINGEHTTVPTGESVLFLGSIVSIDDRIILPSADATHIARLDPQTVASLVTELRAARSQLAKAREALIDIAKPIEGRPIGDPWAFYADLQAVACAALSKSTPTPENK